MQRLHTHQEHSTMDEAISENTWDLAQHNESQWPFLLLFISHTHLSWNICEDLVITIMQLINTMLTPYTNPKPVFLVRVSQTSPQESVWHILLLSVAYNVQTKETELHLQMNNKEHSHSCVYFLSCVYACTVYISHLGQSGIVQCELVCIWNTLWKNHIHFLWMSLHFSYMIANNM